MTANGQRELAEALIGMRPARSASIRLNGREIAGESVAARVALGMSYIPEDRLTTGVAPGLSVEDNLLLRSYRDSGVRRGPFLDYARALTATQSMIDRFDVRGVRPRTLLGRSRAGLRTHHRPAVPDIQGQRHRPTH